MPQLQQIAATYASQLFWLLLVFGFLYFGIAKAMLPKVGRVIESREAKIAKDLAEAQSAQTRASEAQAVQESTLATARGEAHTIVGQATAKAQNENTKLFASLDADLADRVAAAETRINAAASAASAELDKVAAEAAGDIVARLTGQTPTGEVLTSTVSELQSQRA